MASCRTCDAAEECLNKLHGSERSLLPPIQQCHDSMTIVQTGTLIGTDYQRESISCWRCRARVLIERHLSAHAASAMVLPSCLSGSQVPRGTATWIQANCGTRTELFMS
eukprot:4214956-Amphidinium_carterae.1